MGPGIDKLFLEVAGLPVVAHTWRRFDRHPDIHHICLVIRPGLESDFEELARKLLVQRPYTLVPGGAERQDSVWNGLSSVPSATQLVAILQTVVVRVGVIAREPAVAIQVSCGFFAIGDSVKVAIREVNALSFNLVACPWVADTLDAVPIHAALAVRTGHECLGGTAAIADSLRKTIQ